LLFWIYREKISESVCENLKRTERGGLPQRTRRKAFNR
jgi:hypothetical protein